MNREMKDSGIEWIGNIPIDWEVLKTKHIIKWKSEKNNPEGEVLSLYRDFGIIPKSSRDDNHNVTSLDTSSYKVVKVGDLVINKMKAWQGSLAVSDYSGIVSPAYHVAEFINSGVYKKYFHHLMRSQVYLPEYRRLSTGMRIGQWDLSFDSFRNLNTIVPPMDIQKKIVSVIERKTTVIDSVIEKTQSTIEDYKLLKQSIITEAVTKGLDKNVEMKDSGIEWIGEIPKQWNTLMLTQVFNQVKNKNKDLSEDNLLSLSYGNIIKRSINTTDGLLPESFDGYNIINDGDIVLRLTDLQNDQTSLRVGLSRETGIITSAYVTIRKKNNVDERYLYYFLHSFDIYKGFYGMGAGVRQGLNFSGLKKLKLTIPTLEEQEEIVNHIEKHSIIIDELVKKKEMLLVELEQYKKSLIYEYVTGKKEVE